MPDPDASVESLIGYRPDPCRYNTDNRDPYESTMLVTALVPAKARVLDVGCGVGAIGAALVELKAAAVTGIEPNAERAASARSRGVNVVEGYLTEDLCESLGVFDSIVLADVLEHLVDPGAMLYLVKSLIHENGSVVISVPNVAHWSIRLSLLFGRFNYTDCGLLDATHLRWFTRKSLLRFVRKIGYECISAHYTLGLGLKCYREDRFWRMIPPRIQRRVLRPLCNWFPSFFACQFVLKLHKRN